MKLRWDEFNAVIANEQTRTVRLSGSVLSMLLSLVTSGAEIFLWSDMQQSEREQANDLVALASYELMRSAMIGIMFWTPIQPTAAPDEWLLCEGGSELMSDYPELMVIYPGILKNVPTAGRFLLPDMRGRFPLGVSAQYPFLSTGGSATHTLTLNEIPSHSHSYVPPAPNVDLESPGVPDIIAAGVGVPTNTGNAGGGLAHNNMPPYGAAYWYMVGR